MNSKTLEGENGDKSLIIFLTPADVKGTKMLTHEHINKDDNQWMYLPALRRVKRIASRNKSGSFMGSEFSYEDTANASWEKYTYKNDLEEVEFNGIKCYKGTRIPKDKNSGYSKQITYIDATTFLVSKIDYFDRKKELLKTALPKEIMLVSHKLKRRLLYDSLKSNLDVGITLLDSDKTLLDQDLDNLLFATYNDIYGINVKYTILLDCCEEKNSLEHAFGLHGSYIVYTKECQMILNLKNRFSYEEID